MAKWATYIAGKTNDPFWTENQPAFHAYDYGANIMLDVTEDIQALDREEPIQSLTRDDISDGEEAARSSPSPSDQLVDISADDILYPTGLRKLQVELEAKFELENIWSMSYALAVDLGCLDSGLRQEEAAYCPARSMLANRNAVKHEFPRQKDWTFYPVAFSPVYGNFTAHQPPNFLGQNVLTVLRNNLSVRNEGVDALSCGYFQAYTNIKRSVRHRPEDLLVKKSLTTAVLALPQAEITSHHIRARHQKLEAQMRGMSTPENSSQSRPFSREALQVQAAIEAEDFAFRMEQVISMQVSRLCDERRTFTTILYPILQLMRFYLQEPHQYRQILHTFSPNVYPAVLRGFSSVFDKAVVGLQEKSKLLKPNTDNVAIAEAAAAFDRLGSYLFTGSARVVGHRVFKHLGTVDSLRYCGWPYIDPGILNVDEERASINKSRWPRRQDGQPALLHPSILEFHYGKHVGATRQSNVWLRDFRGIDVAGRHNVSNLAVDIFQEMWLPQSVEFITRAVERTLRKRLGTLDGSASNEIRQRLDTWTSAERPFSWSAYSQLMPILSGNADGDDWPAKSRRDVARQLYLAAKENSDKARRRWATLEGSWLAVLASAISTSDQNAATEGQWIGAISSAMLECGIEAMPGSSRGKLSSTVAIRLVGIAPSRALLATRPGTLKRAAVEANESAKRPRLRQRINLQCEIPFVRIPPRIDEALRVQDQLFEGGDSRVREHYCAVRHCLNGCLGDPLCDLMLMLSLTLASCSVTPAAGDNGFEEGKRKDDHVFVVNLITRMLWFLKPREFPWNREEGGRIMPVSEMTKKIGIAHGNAKLFGG